MKKIVAVEIGPMPRPIEAGMAGAFDPMPTITATFEDGEVKELFWFYPDELSFEESEFVGLTEREAHELRYKKDVAYLRSEESVMSTRKIVLSVRQQNAKEWKNIGEFELPILPRIGEHVVVSARANRPLSAFRVVGILHCAPNKGLIDVLAVYDGSQADVKNRLFVQAED